jgi:UDP-N-acetylglucosamine 3-dehydrogenase
MPVKVGIIGVGAMGEHHVRNYCQLPVELIGIFDINPDRAKEVGSKYHVPVFKEPQGLLEKVEAVTIAVPTTLHHAYVLQALRTGVHVLVEKPIASTIKEAMEMIQKARDSNKILMVGHLERLNPAVQATKKFLQRGLLGDVVSITAKRVGPHNPRIRDVGVILDLAIHDIDVISNMLGKKVSKVFTVGGVKLHPFEDYAIICLAFPDHVAGVVETNWLTPKKVRTLTIVGTEGVIEVDYLSQKAVVLKDPNDTEPLQLQFEKKEPLHVELESFIRAVQNGGPAEITAEEGAENLRVALAAVESLKTGREISL